MTRPDFVVVGHAVRDLVPGGWRLGGTVTFAAVQADRLGLSVGVVTSAGTDLDVAAELPFAEVVQAPSAITTVFENIYAHGSRQQHVRSRAAAIPNDAVPADWLSAPIVLVGPVLGEAPVTLASAFSSELIAVSAQGWLRDVDDAGRVVCRVGGVEEFWSGAGAVFASDEDLAGEEDLLERWLRDVPIVAMTESWRGARVHSEGAWRRMTAFPEDEVDPTGAGDTFATALLVRLRECGDVMEAARFGAAAASLSVGGVGAESIPLREQIEARLREYPEVVLR